MLKYTRNFPVTIPIDGAEIRVVIKRMTDGEYKTFANDWNRERQKMRRPVDKRDGEEALTDTQVAAKRESELTLAELRIARERERFDTDESAQFTIDAITNFVTFSPGQVTDEDENGREVDVVTGAQILRCFATRDDVMTELVAQVYLQNTLNPEQKKRLALRSASAPSSSASTETTAGARPAPTASPAEPPATVPIAPVTDATATTSSGTTDLSS